MAEHAEVQELRTALALAQERANEWHDAWIREAALGVRLRQAIKGQRTAVQRVRSMLDNRPIGIDPRALELLVTIEAALGAAVASTPANPYAALVEAARELAVTLYEHNEKALQRYRMGHLGENADLEDYEGDCCDICCEVSDLLRDLAKLSPEGRAEAIRRFNQGEGIEAALADLDREEGSS